MRLTVWIGRNGIKHLSLAQTMFQLHKLYLCNMYSLSKPGFSYIVRSSTFFIWFHQIILFSFIRHILYCHIETLFLAPSTICQVRLPFPHLINRNATKLLVLYPVEIFITHHKTWLIFFAHRIWTLPINKWLFINLYGTLCKPLEPHEWPDPSLQRSLTARFPTQYTLTSLTTEPCPILQSKKPSSLKWNAIHLHPGKFYHLKVHLLTKKLYTSSLSCSVCCCFSVKQKQPPSWFFFPLVWGLLYSVNILYSLASSCQENFPSELQCLHTAWLLEFTEYLRFTLAFQVSQKVSRLASFTWW